VTCKSILAADPSSPDGVYTLNVDGETFDAYCLMNADGGGWTLVANYPPGTTPAVPAGWSTGEQVGTGFSNPAALFKMPDALINAIKTTTYRVHGTATQCLGGPCAVDTMLYWGPDSTACSTAYLDTRLTEPTPSAMAGPSPCFWHWGLVDTLCGQISSTITSHDPSHGIVVCTGDLSNYQLHACNGRGNESAGIAMWVR
jgi:hypothetical protein